MNVKTISKIYKRRQRFVGNTCREDPKMNLRIARTIEGSPKVERAMVKQQLQKLLLENNSAGKSLSKKFSLKKETVRDANSMTIL